MVSEPVLEAEFQEEDLDKRVEEFGRSSHAKSLTISMVCRCCCNFFFVEILDEFHDFVSGMCPFPEENNQQPIWGLTVFYKEK